MPVDIRVTGARELAKLGRDLRTAGDADLKRELQKAAQRIVKPVKVEFPRAAREALPGGLGPWVADRMKVATRLRAGGRQVSLRIKLSRPKSGGMADVSALNRGRARHPTWGHAPWVTQSVEAGWADRVMTSVIARRAQLEFIQTMRQISNRIRR